MTRSQKTTKVMKVNTETHITGICIALPVYGDMSATINFTKALVDDNSSEMIKTMDFNEADGPPQLHLDQDGIIDLVGGEKLNQIRDRLHEMREASVEDAR